MSDFVMGLKARTEHWDERHGSNPVLYNGQLLFPDGAQREVNPCGIWCEPPTDRRELAKLALIYVKKKLEIATAAFHQMQAMQRQQAEAAMRHAGALTAPLPPTADERVELEKLRLKVIALRQEVEAAVVRVEDSKPQHVRQREAEALVRAEQAQQVLESIEQIKI